MTLRFLLTLCLLLFLVSCGCDKSYEFKGMTAYNDGAFSLQFSSKGRQRRVSFLQSGSIQYKDREGKFLIKGSDFNSFQYLTEADDWGFIYMNYASDQALKSRCLGKMTKAEFNHLKAIHPDVFIAK